MTKSELIEIIAARQTQLSVKDVELAVKTLIEQMSETLASGERIEIRGFGSFSLHYRAPRIGRNPKTGESVGLAGKYVPHFKPGKELRDRVNKGLEQERASGGSQADGEAAGDRALVTSPDADGVREPSQNSLFE
jgi:integration host factor subunit beta